MYLFPLKKILNNNINIGVFFIYLFRKNIRENTLRLFIIDKQISFTECKTKFGSAKINYKQQSHTVSRKNVDFYFITIFQWGNLNGKISSSVYLVKRNFMVRVCLAKELFISSASFIIKSLNKRLRQFIIQHGAIF